MTVPFQNIDRIPNFIDTPAVDKDGYFTPEWKAILQQLFTTLLQTIGSEGLVAPTQNAANVAIIQNNATVINGHTIYTCQYGTILYDSTTNTGLFSVNNGSGIPIFKTITLT